MTFCSHSSHSGTSSFCMVFNPHEILILVRNFILLSCKLKRIFVPEWKITNHVVWSEWHMYVYLIWHKNHLSENALGWDGQFYHVNAGWASLWNETKFRNESHSGIKINKKFLMLRPKHKRAGNILLFYLHPRHIPEWWHEQQSMLMSKRKLCRNLWVHLCMLSAVPQYL